MKQKFWLSGILALYLTSGFASLSQAQINSRSSGITAAAANGEEQEPRNYPQNYRDMLMRRRIEHNKKVHLEHLERARQAATLADELKRLYGTNPSVSAAGSKKLEKLEKLLKRIREDNGGEDDDDLRNFPANFGEAFVALDKATAELKSSVEDTPRQVVSAAVADLSNRALAIVRYLRKSLR